MITQGKSMVKNQYDLILEFAQAVVPHNWNVYWNWNAKNELKKGRHTCNIQFQAESYRNILKDDCCSLSRYVRWFDGIMFTQIYLDSDDYDIGEAILHKLGGSRGRTTLHYVKGGRFQARGCLKMQHNIRPLEYQRRL